MISFFRPAIISLMLYHRVNSFWSCTQQLSPYGSLLNTKSNGESSNFALLSSVVMESDEDLFRSIQGVIGVPRAALQPEEIPSLIMNALQNNNYPEVDAGLKAAWEFSGDLTKNVFQHNRTEFIESAKETADEFPTSFYGVAMTGQSWRMITNLNRVGGPEGWIATQVMETISSDGRMRRWQWELRRNRRPPCLGCWRIESIGSSDRKGKFEVD